MLDRLDCSFTEGLLGAIIGAAIALFAAWYQARVSRRLASEQRNHDLIRSWCATASQAVSSARTVVRWIREVDLTYLRGTATHPDHPWPIVTQLDGAIKEIQLVEALAPDPPSQKAATMVREQMFCLKLEWLTEQYYEARKYPGEFGANAKDLRYKHGEKARRAVADLLGVNDPNDQPAATGSIESLQNEITRLVQKGQ
jgi:hypothetical protein